MYCHIDDPASKITAVIMIILLFVFAGNIILKCHQIGIKLRLSVLSHIKQGLFEHI